MDYQKAKELYLNHLSSRALHPKTIKHSLYCLNHFFRFLEEQQLKDLAVLTPQHLLKYFSYKKDHAWTLINHIYVVKRLFNFLCEHHFLLNNPAEDFGVPHRPPPLIPTVLTQEEVNKLLAITLKNPLYGKRDHPLFELMYSCGLRVSEVCRLKEEDVDLNQQTLLIRQGKGKKDRVVPLGDQMSFILKKYIEEFREKINFYNKDFLFLTCRGGVLRPNNLKDLLRKYSGRCGIKKRVFCHLLRHSCATHLLENGAPLTVIQKILGHEYASTTEIYTHVDLTNLKKWHLKYHPQERWPCKLPKP